MVDLRQHTESLAKSKICACNERWLKRE